jgi:outer membrane lipoprotein-sorting protein
VNVLAIAAGDGVTRLELSDVDTSSDFESVALLFSDAAPIGLELRDRLGQITRIRFYSARSNPALAPSDFELQVPDTVDVIDESGL